MAGEFWLDDQQWAAIEPLLPTNQPGAPRKDDRRIISGIIHVLKVGCRWQDCPDCYGPATTIYNRFNRWSRQGIWFEMFERLTGSSGITASVAIDSSTLKVHRSAGGGKGGRSNRPSAARAAGGQPRSTR